VTLKIIQILKLKKMNLKKKKQCCNFKQAFHSENSQEDDSFNHCIEQIVSREKIALKDFPFHFHVYFCLQLLLQQKLQ
jgi:hypothetical protein